MIVFLNGCSSAGKSSLARALQQRLDGLWLVTGIDHAIAMAPPKLHNSPEGFQFRTGPDGLIELHFGPSARALIHAHQRSVAAMACDGVNLILDEVIVAPWMRAGWIDALAGHSVLSVGVHCALGELERREQARGDRMPGQARGQIQTVHAGMVYDITLDSTTTSPEALADQVAKVLAGGASPRTLKADDDRN